MLEEKKGLREGLGVEVMLMVSISGPESDNSSKSSRRSSISAGSMSPPFPEHELNTILLILTIVCTNKSVMVNLIVRLQHCKKYSLQAQFHLGNIEAYDFQT